MAVWGQLRQEGPGLACEGCMHLAHLVACALWRVGRGPYTHQARSNMRCIQLKHTRMRMQLCARVLTR